MDKFITRIFVALPKIGKEISIEADGKNVIITGKNGCGKTVFLTALFESICSNFTVDKVVRRNDLHNTLESFKNNSTVIKTDQNEVIDSQIKKIEERLSDLFNTNEIKLSWHDHDEVFDKFNQKLLLLRFFDANRTYPNNYRSSQNRTLAEIQLKTGVQEPNKDFSATFESYLVGLWEAAYLAYAFRNEMEQKNKVDVLKKSIEFDFKNLFEDESLELIYNEQERRFYIKQDGKDEYTFSNLSSGYSSILQIYTDLLTRAELQDIEPKQLSGIVIIDEIDAHLHVSLQRKILSFFDTAFPNVQFIVSTHSPFVIQSVSNSVIYDLSLGEQLEDLSMYSYESILKGLLGVESKSTILDGLIEELARQIESNKPEWSTISDLVERIQPNRKNLDTHSSNVLMMAEIKMNNNPSSKESLSEGQVIAGTDFSEMNLTFQRKRIRINRRAITPLLSDKTKKAEK